MSTIAYSQGLSKLVKSVRESKGLTQEDLASAVSASRSAIAHFEQGLKVPSVESFEAICRYLEIPSVLWIGFASTQGRRRLVFENAFSEIAGARVTLRSDDVASIDAVEFHIGRLYSNTMTTPQALDCICSILVFYGIGEISRQFFDRYFAGDAFASEEHLERAVRTFQKDAIRLHPTISEAFACFNRAIDLKTHLQPLDPVSLTEYRDRSEWTAISQIPQDCLADLGYISAIRIKSEHAERDEAARLLRSLAKGIRKEGRAVLIGKPDRERRRLDTLLRKLNSSLRHDLSSPLFSPDADALEREALALTPDPTDLQRMASTQDSAYKNLCHYLSADYLDVYVATSMRSDADYVSVHSFVNSLFAHSDVRPLKLRYFNPTQSWIGDRVAKGLVEALMLRRSLLTIYMAQKEDTFGKDSEASVALGQGKPVIVYVPKLVITSEGFDSSELWGRPRQELVREWQSIEPESGEDDANSVDIESMASRITVDKLASVSDATFAEVVRTHWADFDLYGDTERVPEQKRADYRSALDEVTRGKGLISNKDIRDFITSVLVANTARFERRARTFRLAHPLALQVVARTRILNGMLVVRDVDACAKLVRGVLSNELDYEFVVNDENYELVEKSTRSTVRVIPRHELLRAAFERFYQLD